MPRRKTLAKYISDTLIGARWPDLVLNEGRQQLKCPKGEILSIKRGEFHLSFWYYNPEKREYGQRERFSEIVFPKDFDIRKFLQFRRTGSYKLVNERQFKKIVNPLNKGVKRTKLSKNSKAMRFYKDTLIIPLNLFSDIMTDAKNVFEKGLSYRNSTENYLSNIKSRKYNKNVRRRTTYIEAGEFKFLVDRLYLKTKKAKSDFTKYLDRDDLTSVEDLLRLLLKNEVLSDSFLQVLNDYFIKERLRDIIALGRKILSLGSTNLSTKSGRQVTQALEIESAGQLESVWQKYFEKYLLYLIFTYKKIFPKVELKDVVGDKKYPDFIGINHYNGLDVIEIKTHLKNALMWDNSHQNFYFSPEMSKAIVQTTNYMDAIVQERFKNPEDQQKITNFVDEENLYHPRGIIVISSERRLTTHIGENEKLKRDFTKLRNSLHSIEILTFDEIINIADEYIKNIIPKPESERQN